MPPHLSPVLDPREQTADTPTTTRSSMTVDFDILESWSEGFQLGALIILMLIVICNMRRHVLLHKLILLEVNKADF